ncbi:TPA: hypothetical protein P0E12_004974 [Vibrio harveyi]|nr:hypothetical protein [Vibrio harveyi]
MSFKRLCLVSLVSVSALAGCVQTYTRHKPTLDELGITLPTRTDYPTTARELGNEFSKPFKCWQINRYNDQSVVFWSAWKAYEPKIRATGGDSYFNMLFDQFWIEPLLLSSDRDYAVYLHNQYNKLNQCSDVYLEILEKGI